MLHASGHRILFVDADGATNFTDLSVLEAELDNLEQSQAPSESPHGIIVGSRAHLVSTEAVVQVRTPPSLLVLSFDSSSLNLSSAHFYETSSCDPSTSTCPFSDSAQSETRSADSSSTLAPPHLTSTLPSTPPAGSSTASFSSSLSSPVSHYEKSESDGMKWEEASWMSLGIQ